MFVQDKQLEKINSHDAQDLVLNEDEEFKGGYDTFTVISADMVRLEHDVMHFSWLRYVVDEQTSQMLYDAQYKQEMLQFLHEFTSGKLVTGQLLAHTPFVK